MSGQVLAGGRSRGFECDGEVGHLIRRQDAQAALVMLERVLLGQHQVMRSCSHRRLDREIAGVDVAGIAASVAHVLVRLL